MFFSVQVIANKQEIAALKQRASIGIDLLRSPEVVGDEGGGGGAGNGGSYGGRGCRLWLG